MCPRPSYHSDNPSEGYPSQALHTWRGEIGERRAARMSMAITFIISVVLYTANTSLNVFQILAGLFLSSTSTSESTIDAPNRLGVCITYTSIWRAWMSLDAEADSVAKKLFQLGKDGVQRLRAVVQVDNIDIWKRKTNETILNESSLIHMAASYIRAMPSYVDKEVFTPEFQEELLACEGSLKHGQFNQFKPNERDRNHLDQARRLNIAQILLLHLPFFVDHKDRATVVKDYNQQLLDRFAKLPLAHHMPDEETRETKLYPLPAQPFNMGHTSHTANFMAWIKEWICTEGLQGTEPCFINGDWLTWRNILGAIRDKGNDTVENRHNNVHTNSTSSIFHFQINFHLR